MVATIRTGKLSVDGYERDLDAIDQGWTCTELDIGYPTLREVKTNKPNAWGVDDQTVHFAERAITINLTAWNDQMTADDIVQDFGPFLNPLARPVLTFTTHSDRGNVRMITLRPATFTGPMNHPYNTREIHLGFVAPDPIIWSVDENIARALAGASIQDGRRYEPSAWETRYNNPPPGGTLPGRQYPATGQWPTTGQITNAGDVPVRPLLRIVGPITAPVVSGVYTGADLRQDTWAIRGRDSLHIPSNAALIIDTTAKTAVMEGTCVSMLKYIDWLNSTWPEVPPHASSTLRLSGQDTDDLSQVEARWRNGWLT